MKHVALLQGINLGRKRRIAMADLRELMTELGFEDVTTHLQSGNVVFSAGKNANKAAATIERGIAKRFDMKVPVVIRTAKELADIVAGNPLPEGEKDGAKLQVVFLSERPGSDPVKDIDDEGFLPEKVVAKGRELYVWYANGMQRSRLARELSKRTSDLPATSRNWNTVTRLCELAG